MVLYTCFLLYIDSFLLVYLFALLTFNVFHLISAIMSVSDKLMSTWYKIMQFSHFLLFKSILIAFTLFGSKTFFGQKCHNQDLYIYVGFKSANFLEYFKKYYFCKFPLSFICGIVTYQN